METHATNTEIAAWLKEAADLLEQQGANPFRVAAYRKAGQTMESLPEDVDSLLRTSGFQGLIALPGIGPLIGSAISEMVQTGQWPLLERLRGALDPEALLAKVPGIGPTLAHRVTDALHIDTWEALEAAAYDGRLGKIPGFGQRRLEIVRAALDQMLRRRRWGIHPNRIEPSVAALLDVDREYRERDHAGTLRRIRPKRFNPENQAWLPILHTERDHWQFTALYSNTALAHKLGRTRDWVVIYFHTDSQAEGQTTVVTETHGRLIGWRVVRGRENECEEYYLSHSVRSPEPPPRPLHQGSFAIFS